MFSETEPLFRPKYPYSHTRKDSTETEVNSMQEESIQDENIPFKFADLCLQSRVRGFSVNGISNPYFDTFSPFVEENNETATDRFIPCRKQLKGRQYEDSNSQIEIPLTKRSNDQAEPISELYRKMLLTPNSQQDAKIKTFENKNILQYRQQNQKLWDPSFSQNSSSLGFTQSIGSYVTVKRKINKVPFKILDAPTLQDDYYLNLIDWSAKNVLSVGLSSCVYLWNSQNSKVTKLCEQEPSESITSVSWSRDGCLLAVGSTNGLVQVWDPVKVAKIRSFSGHSARVGSIAWNSNVFTTGSRDKSILNRDIRLPHKFYNKWLGHKQEVCGLKWSFDGQQLCSGGNDNRLLIWSPNSLSPIFKFQDHKAAVKAMAWSPHHHGLLVSGGGTADRTIRFRDTLTGTCLKTVDVGSQVCNLMFSKSLNQLVSTHGYSHNEINIWKCPKMEKVATLTGHTMRVLYLSMSPDGSTIVTGAGDETLRFWTAFPSTNQKKPQFQSVIDCGAISLR